jgi:hypothetical protein
MTNPRKTRPQHPATATIAPLDGAKIPGGCAHCDAYQIITAHAYGPDIHRITIYHDRRCPWFQAKSTTNRGKR